MKNKKQLTRFGALVLGIAAEAGITKQTILAAMISKEADEGVNQRRLSGWLRGEHEPPWWFCEILADIFELTEEDMKKLAWANTYHQKTPVNQ